MKSSDYSSRHPTTCKEKRCQICSFASELEKLGDNAVPMVGKVTVEDIEQGRLKMPFTQKKAWVKVQAQDKTHQQLSWLINTSQTPEKKKTKGENTKLKLLHNLYKNGSLKIDSEGLITVTNVDKDTGNTQAISVPTDIYPGLLQAIHLKLNHPSKAQMQRLSSGYFYSPGQARIIDEISNKCSVCASLKQLPAELFSESTVENETFGSHFSADVIRREGQLILLCREKLSQFTTTCIITNETANSLREALISSILEFIPVDGVTIQVDEAPAFQTLQAESQTDGSILKQLNMRIDLGRTFNKNKNPVAENAIKEFHKECLRMNPAGGKITETDRAKITKIINSRIRLRGFSAKEIAFQRDQNSNKAKPISDKKMAAEQTRRRKDRHPVIDPTSAKVQFKVGDNVFLKKGKTKLRGREMFKILDIFNHQNEPWATLLKTETQFRAKPYKVKFSEIFHVPGPESSLMEEAEQSKDEDIQSNLMEEAEKSEDEKILSPTDKDEVTPDAEHTEEKHPVRPSRSHHDDWTGAGSRAGWGAVKDSGVADLHQLENELPKDDRNTRGFRKKRKTARLAREKVQELVANSLLSIKTNLQHPIPPSLHAWNWEAFNQLLEAEEDFRSRGTKRRIPSTSLTLENEADLSWDNSPEQFEIFQFEHIDIDDEDLEPRKLFSSEQSNDDDHQSLTPSTSDDEVFPRTEDSFDRSNKFNRTQIIRKRRAGDQNEGNESEGSRQTEGRHPAPGLPSQVVLHQCQHLNRVLPKRIPVVPENVRVDAVQDLTRVLDVFEPEEIQDHQQPDPLAQLHHEVDHRPQVQPRPRRSPRLAIDYEKYHYTGEKVPRKRL